jgi:hypothetical protein
MGGSAMTLSEAEVWTFLRAIERGDITLSSEEEPQLIYAGNVRYAASNGWIITVFNDCNEWDYVDTIETTDGRTLDFDDMPQALRNYCPSEDVAWTRYGIPGYAQYRRMGE